MRGLFTGGGERPPLGRLVLGWSAVGALVLLVSLGGKASRPVVRGLQVSAEIVRGSREYRQQVRDNGALETELAFLGSEAGKRWAAWRYLGMVEPGWQVGRTVEEPGAAPLAKKGTGRFRDWVRGQQAERARQVREAGEVLGTYTGRRPLERAPEGRNSGPAGVSKGPSGGGGGD